MTFTWLPFICIFFSFFHYSFKVFSVYIFHLLGLLYSRVFYWWCDCKWDCFLFFSDFYHYRFIWLVLELHVDRIMWYIFFCVWLFSPNIISLNSSKLLTISSVQFSRSLISDFCNPIDCSMPGLPVHHQLPELTKTHVHWVDDAIQPSHPLSSPSPTFNLSQHQGLFKWVSSSQ